MKKHFKRIAILLFIFMAFILMPTAVMGAAWPDIVGLLPGTAIVLPSDAPLVDKGMASILKGKYGSRIGICDSVADHTDVDRALAALADTGGVVVLSQGTFNFDSAGSAIAVDESNVTLRGSNGTRINYQGSGNCFWLNGNNITFENLYFIGNPADEDNTILAFNGRNQKILNCIFENTGDEGGQTNVNSIGILIEGCLFKNCAVADAWGASLDIAGGCSDVTVSKCRFEPPANRKAVSITELAANPNINGVTIDLCTFVGGLEGVRVWWYTGTTGVMRNISVTNNKFYGVLKYPIWRTGLGYSYGTISGNGIYGGGTDASATGAIKEASGVQYGVMTVENNTIVDWGDDSSQIGIENFRRVLGNNILNPGGGAGYGISTGHGSIVSGNEINTAGIGIYIGSQDDCHITTNKVNATVGIRINASTCERNIISDNELSLSTTKVQDNGTMTLFRDNTAYLGSGEIRTISGTIATLTENAFNSLDNPFGQAVGVSSLDIYVSAKATATAPDIDCGIGASATTDYTTLFDDLPGETVGFYRSTAGAPGTQTVPQLWESGSGNRYLNMSIKDAAATGMVATYAITVMGL